MTQSTTFAQVATNQFDYLSNALCANTPPYKKHSSSRKSLTLSISLRLLLVMFLTLSVTTNAWGAEYTITFKSASSDSSSDLGATPNVSNVVSSGTSYVASFSGCSKMYVGTSGIKLGSSKATGTMNFTLATNYQSNIKSIKVVSAKYGSDTGTLTLYSGSTSLKSEISPGTDYTHTFSSPTKVTSLKLATSSNRAYITKIVITTEEAATCTTNPTVSAGSHSNITSTTATVSCSSGITSLGSAGCSITSYGFVYGTSSNPTISNTQVQVGTTYTTTGTAFSKGLTGLTANTTYYVRPYATNGNGTAYGTQTSFKTLELPKYTVTLNAGPGTCAASVTEASAGAGVTLPIPTLDGCGDWEFAGWKTTSAVTTETTTEPTLIPAGAYSPTSDITLYAVYQRTETTEGAGTTEVTKTVSISDYAFAKSWNNENRYTTVNIDANITATASSNPATNTGKYYSNDNSWRFYQNETGKLTITANEGITLKSITLTFTNKDSGTISYNSNSCTSNTAISVSGQSATFTVGSSSGSKGKILITKISVTYESTSGGGSTTYYHSTPDCGSTEPSVSFDLNGGSGTFETETLDGDSYTIPETVPTRDGYTFAGWQINGKGNLYQPRETIDGITEPITLVAQWTAKTATSLTWSADTYSATINADNTFPTLTITPADLSPIAYSSSNTNVATIDADGNITLKAAGTTTITATFTETNTHAGSTASYTLTVNPSNCRWVETEIGDIKQEDEVLVTMRLNNGKTYTLDHSQGTSELPPAQIIGINGNEATFLSLFHSNSIWNISGNATDGYILYPNGKTNTWLYCTKSSNNVKVGTTTNNVFTIDNGYLKHTNTDWVAYLGVYINGTTTVWRHHNSPTAQSIANQTLKFYKRECLDASKVWVEGNFTNVTCDTQLPQQLAKDGSISLTFSAADGYVLPNTVTVTNATKSWNQITGTLTISNPTGNVMVTVEAVELHTITWMVGSNSVLTEEVANATGVTQTPADPANGAIGECANAFMGWTETPLGSTEGQSAPADLCTAAQMKAKHTSVTGNKIFYAVFATASSGGGENTKQVFATTDIVSSTGVTTGYTISAQASKENGYYQDRTGDKRYVQVMKSDVSTPMITNIPISITVTAKLGGGSEKNPLTNSVYAIWLDAEGNELGDAVLLTNKITAKTGSDFTANLPIANATSAYGVRVYHQKETSYNVRYYAISLSYKYNDVTYSNYVTQCCTDWTPTLTYSKTTLDASTNETATPTITGNTHNAPVSFESSNTSVLTVDADGTITAVGAGKATITATWEKTGDYCEKSITTDEITVNGNFLVTFYANDGSENTTTQQIPSNTATALNANTFQRDGYTFQGWATSASGAKEYDDKQEVTLSTSGLDLYAVWQVKAYNITTGTITGEGTITTSPANSANCDAQVTITATPAAHYTLTSVTVTRDDNSQTVSVGGNKFTMPASDVTITAVFTENEKFTINYAIPTGGGTLTDNAPTSIYIDGSITLPGIKDGTISSEYSCEEFIGWTTNPANHEAAGLKPEPFYNTGASFSDVSEDVTFYPVYSRSGAGVGGTVTLTAEEMEGWSVQQSYGTLRELVTCHGTWKTTGVKSTGNPIQLRDTDNPYVEFPELQGNITQVVLNATNGSNATLTSGTFTLKTLDGQTTIASASVNNSGVCTLTVTGSYKTARLYSSVTARIANISISYGPAAIVSTNLKCTNDFDECTITYDLNESLLPTGTTVYGACADATFSFSEIGTYTICATPIANEHQLLGWNNQCDGKGSINYTPGQVISSLPQNNIVLYAQWAPQVIVHDSYEETFVYPTEAGESITLNPGTQGCDPKKYDFIGWTDVNPLIGNSTESPWNQTNTPPTLLPTNLDGTVTYTPDGPSEVYAVYAIEDQANSSAFVLSSNVEGVTYYVGYDSNRSGGVRAKNNVADALQFYKEVINAKENKYLIYYVDPDEQDKEYLYYSSSALSTSNDPSNNPSNYGWIFNTSGTGYKFQSIAYSTRYLSITTSNVQTNTTGSVFNMETVAEYQYVAKTNCTDQVTITFVPGNGTMTPSNTIVTAKSGDIITLPECEFNGWTFLGWVTDNVEETERPNVMTIYTDAFEVGNSDITLYAYYTCDPEPVPFDGNTDGVWKIYSEVTSGTYKYANSHTSNNPATLPASDYCPNAEDWTFVNVGEPYKYYIKNEAGKYLTPESNTKTGFTFGSTPQIWNIESAGNDQYKIFHNETPDRLIMCGPTAFYNTSNDNINNPAWHLVFIGGCINSVYTTDPQEREAISITGTLQITSAVGQTVKAADKITLTIKNMPSAQVFNISADNLTFYDEENNVVTSLQAGDNGSLTSVLSVAYTPIVADILETPQIKIEYGGKIRSFRNVSCRSLPATFAIVAKVGNLWYALPSQGLNSTTPPAAYPVEVDDMADPTAVFSVPANADWSLRQVLNDRFTANGENLVFVNNASPAMALNASSSEKENYLLTDAQYNSYYSTNPGLYEWTPTTTDLETYQLTNEQRSRTLSVNTATVFGVHAQNKAVEQVRFLPITGRYTPAALQVVEWKKNSVVIMYNGDPAQTASVSVNGGAVQTTELSGDGVQKDIAVYELAANGLATNPTQSLSITIGSEKVILPIPYIVGGDLDDATLLGGNELTIARRQEIAKISDLVILNGGSVTAERISTNYYKFRNVTIYGGGSLVIPSDKGFGANSLTMRVGGVEAGEYVYTYPQLDLNGTINSGNINLDLMTTYDYYYPFSVPYEVTLTDIHYPIEIYGSNVKPDNKGSFLVSNYDGEARAQGNTGWKDVEEQGKTVLSPHVGYSIWGLPKKVSVNGATSVRQTYGIHRIPMKKAADVVMSNETTNKNVDIFAHNATRDNDKGWNFIGNPYLVQHGGLDGSDADVYMGLLVKEMKNDQWTGGWVFNGEQVRYVTQTNDCLNYTSTPVADATIPAFSAFFIQAKVTGAIAFTSPNVAAAQSLTARRSDENKEINTGIILSGEKHSDRTGLLIADEFTEAYEFNADLSKFDNQDMNLYTISPSGKLAFMAINEELAKQTIPLGYSVSADGMYTIAFDEQRYNRDDIYALYLIDYDRNEITNLLHMDYDFYSDSGASAERFALQVAFAPSTTTDVEYTQVGDILVSREGNTLRLDNLPSDATVTIYDAVGHLIEQRIAPQLLQLTLQKGYYLIHIGSNQNSVVIDTFIP